MSKEEVLANFQIAIDNKTYEHDGNLLLDDLLERAQKIVINDREGLVEALRYWISLREQFRTEKAVILTKYLVLKELKLDLDKLRDDIVSGKYLPGNHTGRVDRALKAIDTNN